MNPRSVTAIAGCLALGVACWASGSGMPLWALIPLVFLVEAVG